MCPTATASGTPLPFPRCSMFDSYRGRFYRVTELTRPGNVDPLLTLSVANNSRAANNHGR
jgi:hypothetical protein